ncbi:uncharacterized protein B0H64DRAFT_413024 [Chaetomium fimeti]|uniref:Uncharacterized protein n=1 Tax=Chaetomium fimeti TaxID=1854472 RepID=A0AAE0H5V7_9PEZI|nr:hypothetical protein B0H64DRAFT_413024 [Chaetomium fimeti]
MELNVTLAASSKTNSSNNTLELTGWNPSDTNRGSIDILWSCCIIIILCCWVSTFPNITSLNDKWYHAFVDKFNLACIGFLGPDYLFAIALGQLSSAMRSVRLFQDLSRVAHGRKWTLVHGFFADMGGFTLVSPDYPPFPVNAEQLHYLVKHGHVDFPSITKPEIKALSKTDSLSKVIVLWQVLWFSASELQRVRQGLPMTTFELTALSFSLTMLITSLCWYAKPTSSTSIMLHTNDGRSVQYIRAAARSSTHPGLSSTWCRSPFDFISPHRRFRVDVHWSYYARLTYMVKVPFFSREIKTRLWDRLPSDAWLVVDRGLLAPAFLVIVGFSVSPLIAWNWHFPTDGERLAWRVCSIYHAAFSIALGVYYIYAALLEDKKAAKLANYPQSLPCTPKVQQPAAIGRPALDESRPSKICHDVEAGSAPPENADAKTKGVIPRLITWLRSWRNISPDRDPDMAIGLHATFPALIGTFLYIFCRIFFYVEDFAFASLLSPPLALPRLSCCDSLVAPPNCNRSGGSLLEQGDIRYEIPGIRSKT